MNTDTQRFNKLLEKYVLRVAEVYIAEVDAETQAQLIRLFIEIGNESVATKKLQNMHYKIDL